MITRREILAALGALPAASVLSPGKLYAEATAQLPKRTLGRTGHQVVPLGLGGIGSIAHPAPGMDAADIVVRAGEKVLLSLLYRPQLTEEPLSAVITASEAGSAQITIVASTSAPRSRA